MALSGRTALVGAASATVEGLQAAGAAYFFTEGNGGRWIQQQRVTDPGVTSLDAFGSVALHADTALIGADGTGTGDQNFRGAVYAYTRDGAGQWSLKQTFYAKDSDAGDEFGSAVALVGDTALIGAPFASIKGASDTSESGEGKAYFFARGSDGAWRQKQELLDPIPHLGDNFGSPLALDGATAAISAPFADINGIQDSGAVHIYRRDSAGNWNLETTLTGSDAADGVGFGLRIALSGNTVLVSAKHATVNGHTAAGAVYVFVRNADGVWTQQARLTASDAAEEDRFGTALALENNVALIASHAKVVPVESRQVFGAVYKFVRDPATGNWTQQQELTTPDPPAQAPGAGTRMAGSLAISGRSIPAP